MTESKAIDSFRRQFFKSRLEKVRTHGVQVFDEAALLLRDLEKDRDVLVTDAFPLERPHGSINHFMAGIAASWWMPRQPTATSGSSLSPRCGLYAHFLPQTNYDIIFEFEADKEAPKMIWRLDARGRAAALPTPKNDGDFRDQAGTFLDLRFGWRWLANEFSQQNALVAAEVESGYVIGIRPATEDAEVDPLERVDPAVEELADRYGRTRFDCAEILNSEEAGALPFAAEVFCNDLLQRYLPGRRAEVFVLASSENFLGMVEEFAEHEGVQVELTDHDDELRLHLTVGAIRHSIAFAYPFLRTLYTARSFPDGVREFLVPLIRQVAGAHDIHERVCQMLPNHEIKVDDMGVMTVSDEAQQLTRLNLFRTSGQMWTHSAESDADLLRLIGLDPDTKLPRLETRRLDQCSICGQSARVSKLIRPLDSIGEQTQKFAGIPTDRHLIYFVQECPSHSVPLELLPGQGIGELETAYQDAVSSAVLSLLHAESDANGAVWYFVGHDAGSLILEAGRITGLMHAFDIEMESVWGLAFFADVIVLAQSKPSLDDLTRLRHRAREYVQPIFPDRLWRIDMVRSIDPSTPPIGDVLTAN